MKKIVIAALAAILCLPLAAQKQNKQKQAEAQPDFSLFEKKEYDKDGYKLPYRILWPENMKKGEKYPLFLFLHGMGKRGTENERQLDRGAPLFLDPANRKKYPCIALYPQAPKTSAFVEVVDSKGEVASGGFGRMSKDKEGGMTVNLSPYGNMVYDLIEQLIKQGVVDTDRIYVSGSSMGGFSTYTFLAKYPDLWAAACPMAGGTDLRTVKNWAGKVPVWIVHGDQDPVVSPDNDRKVVEMLKQMGVTNYRYSEYKGVKHDSWDNAFAEPDYLEWFFSKSKSSK